MALVDNLETRDKKQEASTIEIKKLLEAQLETKNFYLVISTDDVPKKEFGFLLKKPVLFQEFKSLTGLKWKKFVEEEVKKRNFQLSISNYQHLIINFVGDCYGLINELDKMELGGVEIATSVARGDLPRNYGTNKIDFFSAIQRLARENLQTQLPVLERLLDNEDPGKVFNVLAYSVDSNKQVRMADYDVAVKSGKLEYEEVLLDFVLRGMY